MDAITDSHHPPALCKLTEHTTLSRQQIFQYAFS